MLCSPYVKNFWLRLCLNVWISDRENFYSHVLTLRSAPARQNVTALVESRTELQRLNFGGYFLEKYSGKESNSNVISFA